MGYLHIDNLYKNQEILMFKECYAMEKIHGTSAHIKVDLVENLLAGEAEFRIIFFSGGAKHETFKSLFNEKLLIKKFKELDLEEIIIYGEAYGGKMQGMRDTYGDKLKFIAFDVKIGHSWLSVPDAEKFVKELGLEFVYYEKIETYLEDIDRSRDCESNQAIKNGMGEGKKREGIVLRPLIELKKNNGARIIAKHKRDDFRETKTPRKVLSPEKQKVWTEAKEIADEFVTIMRLVHILDKIDNPKINKMKEIILAMQEDIKREAGNEVIWSKEVAGAIGRKTAILYKEYLKKEINENWL